MDGSIAKQVMAIVRSRRESQTAIARRAKISQATLSHLMTGRTPDPRSSTIEAIVHAIGMTIDLSGARPRLVAQDQPRELAKSYRAFNALSGPRMRMLLRSLQ